MHGPAKPFMGVRFPHSAPKLLMTSSLVIKVLIILMIWQAISAAYVGFYAFHEKPIDLDHEGKTLWQSCLDTFLYGPTMIPMLIWVIGETFRDWLKGE